MSQFCPGRLVMEEVIIDLYTRTTPNRRKVSVMLEECGIPCHVHPVNISQSRSVQARVHEDLSQQQDSRDCRQRRARRDVRIGRDTDSSRGENRQVSSRVKSGTRQGAGMAMWQMANIGPMIGQTNHFANVAPEKIPYAIDRYMTSRRDC
jgi:GSH-dependent disulfide-bond oxidoreductase